MTSRHRSRTINYQENTLTVDFTRGGTDTSHGPFVTDYETEGMDDVVTPNYHKRIAAGEIINNPCGYEHKTLTTKGEGYAHHRLPANGSSYDYTLSGPLSYYRKLSMPSTFWTNPPLDVSNADPQVDRAKTLAIARIDATPYAFGEDALEVGETLRFLRHPLESILGIGNAIRRGARAKTALGKRNTQKEYIRACSNAYLQYRFALSPLIRSISDALAAFEAEPKTLPERLTSRGHMKSEDSDSSDFSYGGRTFHRSLTRKYDTRASILYTVSNPIRDWRYRLGFRPKDLPTTLWQIVPYSFMVDRVVDVSSFCAGIINLADPRVRILSACVVETHLEKTSYQLASDNQPGWTIEIHGDVVEDETYTYYRNPWNPSVFDLFRGLNPDLLNLVNSATKTLDLVSLILQRFRW
jgi:hypothetical protein